MNGGGGDWTIDKVYPIPAEWSVSVSVEGGGDFGTKPVDVYCFLEIGKLGTGVVRVVPGVVSPATGEVEPLYWDGDGDGT